MAAAAAQGLLGPPSIHAPPPPTTGGLLGPPSATAKSAARPPMGLTENQSPTFLTSGDPCLDFFFQIVPDTPANTVNALLAAAWAHDPLTALKLACHLRAIRGTGKSDRKSFYAAALWLHRYHPKTLALNADAVAEFGYMKDLPEILHRLVVGPGTFTRTRTPKRQTKSNVRGGFGIRRRRTPARTTFGRKPNKVRSCKSCRCKNCRCTWKSSRTEKKERTVEMLAEEIAKVKIQAEEAADRRHEKRAAMAAAAVKRYASDPHYRLLHDRTSDLFAALLSSDLQLLKSGDMKHFSLAAKWCPSLNSSYDRSTLLCETIARRIFPRDSNPEYLTIEEQHYAYRVRDRLRKEVLVPLRKALKLPEVYICAGQWGSLPYSRVASVAMKNYKDLFKARDAERFSEFLGKVKEGKAKIAAGALLPHQIIAPFINYDEEEEDEVVEDEVAELQWKRMVSDLSERGRMSNCIAVCDVSGSMSGTPMEVCVALGMLVSELSEEPWKGRVITFSESPQLHRIEGESLKEKVKFVKEMDWGGNTNFQQVFDRILDVAVEGKLNADKMIKRVFVFSDMEFDQASENSWETDYEAICRKFQKSSYPVPEIVFWNLRDSRSTPVPSGQKGVALVSGFSKNLMKMFLENDGILSPKDAMETAISGEEYQKLVVYD